jgi:RNase P/RNase MRP subunit p29
MKLSAKKTIEYGLLLKPLIGKDVEILDSSVKPQIGVKGILVLETANLFHIETKKETIKVLKSNITIKLSHNNQNIKLDCKLLKGTLTQRLKKLK